ncbi:BAR-domain-containing protein [Panus rudis PR-1116 ss-1]|nr:BAR-domain-containing protein [Panus rudis PR-1116 ss-1]
MDPSKQPPKRRKLTDKNLPSTILNSPYYAVDSQMYQDLLQMERKLDWTMTRKKAEVQDALGRTLTTTRTLRIFLSHTVSGQTWQQSTDPTATPAPDAANPETGENIPAFQFKVEGRLLEIPNQRAKDRVPPRKFSTFLKSMVIELDRDPAQYPEGNIAEFNRTANNNTPLDGFTIRRRGDTLTKIRVVIHLDQQPEVYKVHPELGSILGIREDTRVGIQQAFWIYVKIEGLQDKLDRKMIRLDARLRPLFNNAESISFYQIPEILLRYLLPPDPIVLHYTLDPSKAPPEKPIAYDVEVKVDDAALRARMNHVVIGMSQDTARELSKIDDEIAFLTQSLTNSHNKHTFLRAFADDPQGFIQSWLESQSRDLDTILTGGPSEGAMRLDDLRRSEYFRLPWVEEAVAVQEGMRKAARAGLDCMATKQLGKLRQWAGEKISSKDKTSVSDEFKDLERDIELRRQGLWRLHIASEDYKHALSKKKQSEALPDEDKLLPIDALGLVMIQHGEQFGDESAFGTSLVSLGKAHCKIATLQESFAISLESSYIDSVKRAEDEIKEYQHQRKKMESRRLSLDAAYSRLERLKSNPNAKKDKERRDAEEEYEIAKARYEEASHDVHARMSAIQENEIEQLRSLTQLLQLEVNFIEQYMGVIREVKDGWVDEDTIQQLETYHRQHHKPPPPPTATHQTDDSVRSVLTKSPKVAPVAESDPSDDELDVEPEKQKSGGFRARAKSFTRRKSDAGSKAGSRAPSRPQSRAEKERKRSDSTATATSIGGKDTEDEKEDKKKVEKTPKRMSVTGWATSKFGSLGGNKGRKEREKFSALMDDRDDIPSDDEGQRAGLDSDESEDDGSVKRPSIVRHMHAKSKSNPTTPSQSPKVMAKLLQRASTQASPSASPRISPPLQSISKPKVVVALYDFNASSPDELSFKTGDQIVVSSEPTDGWWMGEVKNGNGKKGLFPVTYTRPLPDKESIGGSSSSLSLSGSQGIKSSLSRRPVPLTDVPPRERDHSDDDSSALGVSATIPMTHNSGSHFGFGGHDDPGASDVEEEQHPFGDQFMASTHHSPLRQHRFKIGQGPNDGDSMTSSEADLDDDRNNLVSVADPEPQPESRATTLKNRIVHPTMNANMPPVPPPRKPLDASTAKRPPPPPPPRRNQSISQSGSTSSFPPPPPVLPRRPSTLNSRSSQSSGTSSFVTVAQTTTNTPVDEIGADGITYSPFDSPRDSTFFSGACKEFKQHPFKPKGMCSNCFQMHG